MAKVKFERAKADLRENIEEKETDLIPAAVDKLEKLWSEFDHLLSLKIAGTESEDVDELTKNARKITREKERIISEAKRLIEPEMATGANKRKTVGNGRRIKVARWSDVTEMKSDVLTGKGRKILPDQSSEKPNNAFLPMFQFHRALSFWARQEQARAPLATYSLAKMSLRFVFVMCSMETSSIRNLYNKNILGQ